MSASKISETAMGDNDAKNIFYINLNPNFKNNDQKALLTKMNDYVRMTTEWIAIQTGQATQSKMDSKELPSDDSAASQITRGNYRTKVSSALTNGRATWLSNHAMQSVQHRFTSTKDDLHFQLLSPVLPSGVLKKPVKKEFENVLNTISDSIYSTLTDDSKPIIWILMAVYNWDNTQKKVQPLLRVVAFETSSDLIKIVRSKKMTKDDKDSKDGDGVKGDKNAKDTKGKIEVSFDIQIMDCVFNNDLFERGPLDLIQKYLTDHNVLVKNKAINIPVDV